MESIVLLGAEDVRRASSQMASAATDMNHAASRFEDTIRRHEMFMDDWLNRLAEIHTPPQEAPDGSQAG